MPSKTDNPVVELLGTKTRAFIETFLGETRERVVSLREEMNRLETLKNGLSLSLSAIDQLVKPRIQDPGKYSRAFFLIDKNRRPVVLKGLVDELWLKEEGGRSGRKPPFTVIDNPDNLLFASSSCSQTLPVIMSYEQTEDSPDGDTWEKRFFVITAFGTAQEVFPPETSPDRFL